MRIKEIFNKKKPVLSFEIFPPKKEGELKNIDVTLQELCQLHPDFISVTFGAGGSVSNNLTIEIAKKIKYEYDIEPLVHLTCLHYTKKEITQILEELQKHNIQNILALRGDRNPSFPEKQEFHYAAQLIQYIKGTGEFGISAACYPEGHLESENTITDMRHLRQKVEAGAEHLISQLFFDNQYFYDFVEKARIAGIDAPIDAGVMPATGKNQIERMVNMCGASLPEKFKKVLDKYGDNKEAMFDVGMVYAMNQIVDLIANGVDGIHIYTMNNPIVARRICNEIKNLV